MLPIFLKPFFWSYEFKKIDKSKNTFLIIFQILNYGTKKSTDWVLNNYERQDIIKCIKSKQESSWNKKSLNYWKIIFDLK